jgi:glycosyltransferase involved in cell wall biosynthesis
LKFNKWLAHQVDFVISVSENCRQDYINVFQIDPALTATITIGTVIPNTTVKSNITNLPARFWINVASLVPEKNHKTLLTFYKMYRKRGGEADLVVVGDGKEKESLLEQSRMLSIDKYVHFLGYRKDAVQIMSQADALILPSLIEGLPGVILEALAYKVPVIASAVGGIPEVIRHKETGLLVGVDDKEEFCGAMFLLESNLSLKRTIVENGFTLCKSEYTIGKVAERFIQQYKSVIRE